MADEKHETIDLRELAKRSKEHFAAGEFKAAGLLVQQIREAQTFYTYVQTGDGSVHVVEKEDDGKTDKVDKRTGELVTKELE